MQNLLAHRLRENSTFAIFYFRGGLPSHHILVRLIGDELADRGEDDRLTLAILLMLHLREVPYEILHSNHGMEFRSAFENYEKNRSQLFCTKICMFTQSQSILGLNNYVTDKNATPLFNERLEQAFKNERTTSRYDELAVILKRAYLPKLKLISYSLQGEDNITIYSHAPIGLETIRSLAEKFGISYQDDSVKQLSITINQINAAFEVLPNIHSQYEEKEKSPIYFAAWNIETDSLTRPSQYKDYLIRFVHGHYEKAPEANNITNLDADNYLGKDTNSHTGNFAFFYSDRPAKPVDNNTYQLTTHQENIQNISAAGFFKAPCSPATSPICRSPLPSPVIETPTSLTLTPVNS